MTALTTPVAFFVFNRPELTERVFERIREARPEKLFIICDGPRPGVLEDSNRVAMVRKIVDNVDWSCEVVRDYAETNLGCRLRVSSGLNWVFEQVEEAIILEDDTLPDPTFFRFCAELLERHRNDARIMHIGGCNLAAPHMRSRESYWISRHAWIWGWASWRRAWVCYDLKMKTWEERYSVLEATFASRWERQFWFAAWSECRENPATASTWDFPWMFSVRAQDGLAILPTVNLVENIGFGPEATHTQDGQLAATLSVLTTPMQFPLQAPRSEEPSRLLDQRFTAVRAGPGLTITRRILLLARLLR